jgi:electron transfer flavoprotein alpha subunit
MQPLRFLVFIKQVPEANEIRFNSDTRTIVRDGVKNIINPYDRRAISEAVRYRNENGGKVVVATMGPPQAREALAEAIIMGADNGVHILDRRLAGSDTLVTAKVLAAAAKKIGFDLILAGQHSTDSETGQVPSALAELLQLPAASSVRRIEYGDRRINVICETDEGTAELSIPLPAVLSAAERLIKPIKVKEFDANSVPAEKIEVIGLEDLDLQEVEVGLAGSPTWVADIIEQRISRSPEVIDGSDPVFAGNRILDAARRSFERKEEPVVPSYPAHGDRQYWCLVEHYQNRVRGVTLEMIGTAAHLAESGGGHVCAIIIGGPVATQEVLLLGAFGADRIYHALDTNPHEDHVVDLLTQKIRELKPNSFFFPSTSWGRSLAPRIAARLGLGLTGDVVGLRIDELGRLAQIKPAFGDTILAPIYSRTEPQMVTVRPGALPHYRPRTGNQIPVLAWAWPSVSKRRFEIIRRQADAGSDAVKLDGAEFVVCIGMGLGQDNVPAAFRFADLMHGAVGATRRVVDSGWLHRQYQVGLTGKFIAPATYLALGVSGRSNHTIGIQKAGTIIAVNQDPNAEIFKIADLGIIGDAGKILRQLIETLEHK